MLTELPRSEWNAGTAAHLLNRAGFGGTPAEIGALAKRAPADAVDDLVDEVPLVDPLPEPSWMSPDAAARPNRLDLRRLTDDERQQRLREYRIREGARMIELRTWWLQRMRTTQRPLQEKLTLFWHGHFATSMEKVRSAYAMYRQNATLRAHAAGSWEDLVAAVAKDPAMLVYLDNAMSRAGQPNENFARELMELFTLGEGQYSEQDVQEAARAFTGWSLAADRFEFQERPRMRDGERKRVLGKSGRFTGDDVIRIVLDQPAAGPFICRKLWAFFAYEEPEPAIVDSLAATLRAAKGELRPVLKSMFRSRAFYSARAVRMQIKSPVQWLIATLRSLDAPLPDGVVCASILHGLGQDLFAPPNVKGWPGGTAWITTDTLLKRYNFAGLLVKGADSMLDTDGGDAMMDDTPGPMRRVADRRLRAMEPVIEPGRILTEAIRRDTDALVAALEWMLYQGPMRPRDRESVTAYVKNHGGGRWSEWAIRDLMHVMMSTPQFQLC